MTRFTDAAVITGGRRFPAPALAPARLPVPGTKFQPILIRQHDHAQYQDNLICIIAPVSAKHL